MNKNELKRILKPLIKQCIKEVIFEEGGALSHIISEVASGLSASSKTIVNEQVKTNKKNMHFDNLQKSESNKKNLREQRKKLLDAIGKDAYNGVNVFEGTTPAPSPTSEGQSKSALSGVAPSDPGVDISNLFGAKAFAMSQRIMEKK
jgi:hypothetical protein